MIKNSRILDNRGALILEFTIYFPTLFLAFLMFVMASLIVTQRVVLDRAVSQATAEAADFLSGANRVGHDDFSNQTLTVRANPYANLISGRWHPFSSRDDFFSAIDRRVDVLSRRGVVGGLAGTADTDIEWSGFLVGGDLTVKASQGVRFPIQAFGIEGWTFESQATVRVFNNHSLMSDAQFVFDVVLRTTGFNMNDIFGDLAGRAVDAISEMIGNKIEGLITDLRDQALRSFSPV